MKKIRGTAATLKLLLVSLIISGCGPSVEEHQESIASAAEVILYAVEIKPYWHVYYADWTLSDLLAELEKGTGVKGVVRLNEAEKTSFSKALTESVAGKWAEAACFDPHHVVVARSADNTTASVLCFDCERIVILDAEGSRSTGLCDLTGLETEWRTRLAAEGIQMDVSNHQSLWACGDAKKARHQ